ncbi:restriction endonuclease subunit S [Sphaerospermopsis kisseleviana CS-549]|uniref:Restriction endonuclease subunit S n=1 Tax=Sphaerospermopsis kisseleviana CS-549 TaxID=3021783 RepID=A0ABT4ZNA3_9CYAN|nr:restriction endonuclease subunit S [Sphaerospermopsis kisseleviana]MDB9440867.1 restriction endonuclease subunit S [Sphaerospermopsis kisseleviana CS-549]BAZ80110.1 type I restriction-modification enzyme S subunit [Sphaerospermopsis kisseleviana NIES-73]
MNKVYVSLDEICQEIYRYPTYYGIEYCETGIPEVRGELITSDGSLDLNKHKWRFISKNTSLKFPRTTLLKGDLVMSVRGTIGKVALIPPEFVGANITANLIRISPNRLKVNERYLWRYMRSNDFIQFLDNASSSTTIKTIKAPDLKNHKIPLPPLEEQKRIAEILDQAEELRRKRKEAIAQLDTLTQSIFFEMFGDPVKNPKGWTVSKLGDITEKITDGEHQTPKRTLQGIKLLSARNIQNGYIDVRDVDYISVEEHERIKKRCNPVRGDILISCSGTIGRVTTVDIDEPFSLVRSVALLKLNYNLISSKFIEYFLRTPALHAKMQQRANASSQANLFQNQIRELPALLPPLSLQQEFAQRVEAVEELKKSHHASLLELDALFASLQHRAFKGEL